MTFKEIWKYMQDTEGWQIHPDGIIYDDVVHKVAGIRFYATYDAVTVYDADGSNTVYRPGAFAWLLLHWPAHKIRKRLGIKK